MDSAEIAIIFIVGSLTLLVFVLFVVLILFEYRKRQVRHITEKLELKHKYQSEVLQTQLEVQEQSFKYISEEIHDNIAQMLSLIKIKLYKVATKTTEDEIRSRVEDSNELLGQTLDDLRTLSHTLSGSLIAKISLEESLDKELNYIRDDDMEAELTTSGEPFEISGEKRLLAFRIIQEAVNNAIKHGKAKRINIKLVYQSSLLVIDIVDDGKGFDKELMNTSKGLGLQNMQLRANMLGSMEVISEDGKGTTIRLNIKEHE